MKKDNGVTAWKVTSVVLLVLLVGTVVYFISNPLKVEVTKEVIKQEEPSSLIYTDFISWSPELGNNNNKIFEYFVYNFGEIEAKDIIVQCVVTDQNDNIVKRVTKNFGNLASKSSGDGEMYEYISDSDSDHFAYCLTKSCSGNCDVLEHEIPELNKYF